MPPRALAAVLASAGVLLLFGCGEETAATPTTARVTEPPAALPTEAQVRDALLTADDLGVGWVSRSVPRESPPLCGVAFTPSGAPVRGRAGFRKAAAGPFVTQRFVGFPPEGAAAMMSRLRAALADCAEGTVDAGGVSVKWTVTVIPSDTVGDESVAVRLQTGDTGQGLPARADEVIFRRGEFVGGVAVITLGDADPTLVKRAVQAADRKLFVLAGG
jgi:hypothetical protein